jgi:hypothetical protein
MFYIGFVLQEIMHGPQIAADGFTHEGDAIREWLENGHDTSPMTNLKLNHLSLGLVSFSCTIPTIYVRHLSGLDEIAKNLRICFRLLIRYK